MRDKWIVKYRLYTCDNWDSWETINEESARAYAENFRKAPYPHKVEVWYCTELDLSEEKKDEVG